MEKFTFAYVPKSVEELKALPESLMDSPYKSAALTMLVLCNYKSDPWAQVVQCVIYI